MSTLAKKLTPPPPPGYNPTKKYYGQKVHTITPVIRLYSGVLHTNNSQNDVCTMIKGLN